jgi:8-amino-7-oxononanoate synthase
MGGKFDFIDEELARRATLMRQRRLLPVEPGQGAWVKAGGRFMLNFCSNDYLGLSRHPVLSRRASEYVHCFGAGSTASRLVCGNQIYFEPVEAQLALLKGTEAALIFNSGYQANVSILPALADRDSLILSDRLNHNSLIQGARLARCRVEIFEHNDMDHLQALLQQHGGSNVSRTLIVTESIFSMDGDQCPMEALVALSQHYGAILVVDEAHATGVAGPKGMGLTCGQGVDVTIGTFSKGCGSFGAYVACAQKMRDFLINCCGGIIYSTALPSAVLGAISGALDLIPEMDAQRRELHRNAERLRSALRDMGWDCGCSTTQIIPVVAGKEADTLALAQWLEENKVFATAIRPPTVEKDRSRIRLAVTALHQKEDIERVIDAFERWQG